MILLLMGVSGAGKTTIGELLAARLGWRFEDGDTYHPLANREKMARGEALTDRDREPWLKTLHALMAGILSRNEKAILACSALKQAYRDLLLAGFAPGEVQLVLLEAPRNILEARVLARHHEFMNPDLLDSQLATLETPSDAWDISVAGTPEDAVEHILARLKAVQPSA